MNSPDLPSSIEALSQSIQNLTVALHYQPFWNSNWFAALIGALSAIVVTSVIDDVRKRRLKLREFYAWIMEQGTFSSPSALLHVARITMYGHTFTKNGVSTEVPEKPLGEKMVIELRKHTKYWLFPYSRIRLLFHSYERTLQKIPADESAKTVESNLIYKEAEEIFNKIMRLAERKTGDNQWTVR